MATPYMFPISVVVILTLSVRMLYQRSDFESMT